MKMSIFEACDLIEGFVEPDSEETAEQEIIAAWQFLIDTGTVWNLQGFYGRGAANLIDAGICTTAEESLDHNEELAGINAVAHLI